MNRPEFFDTIPANQQHYATLLAGENILLAYTNSGTAMFNLKTRVLSLPRWRGVRPAVIDLLTAHEVAHAILSPLIGETSIRDSQPVFATIEAFEAAMRVVLAAELPHLTITPQMLTTFCGYVNVVEDARIERLIKVKYRGLPRVFFEGYRSLHSERDFFRIGTRPLGTFSVIDRLNLSAKIGRLIAVPLTSVEQRIYAAMMRTTTYDEVLWLSAKIFAFAAQQESESASDMAHEAAGPADVDDVEAATGTTGRDDDGPVNGAADPDDADDEFVDASQTTQEAAETAPASSTDAATKDSMTSFVQRDGTGEMYLLPSLSEILRVLPKAIVPLATIHRELVAREQRPTDLVHKFRKAHGTVIDLMAMEFERRKRAEIHQRTRVVRTGTLDSRKLHKIGLTDNIFLRHQIVPKGKRHGMIMLVDFSGSMGPAMDNVLAQVTNLAWFCRKIQIPFDLYGFTTRQPFGDDASYSWSAGDGGVWLLHLLSGETSPRAFTDGIEWLTAIRKKYAENKSGTLPPVVHLSGSTGLYQALLLMPGVAHQFRQRHSVEKLAVVVMTDGEDNCGCPLVTTTGRRGTLGLTDGALDTDWRLTYGPDREPFSRLVEWVGHRSGADMIGLHLSASVEQAHIFHDTDGWSASEIEVMRREIHAHGWASVPVTAGFARAYVVAPSALRMDAAAATPIKASPDALIDYKKRRDAAKTLATHMVDQLA